MFAVKTVYAVKMADIRWDADSGLSINLSGVYHKDSARETFERSFRDGAIAIFACYVVSDVRKYFYCYPSGGMTWQPQYQRQEIELNHLETKFGGVLAVRRIRLSRPTDAVTIIKNYLTKEEKDD